MSNNEINKDKAGQSYWNKTWEEYPLPCVWDVDSKELSKHVEHEFFQFILNTLEKLGKNSPDVKLIEVGCAKSQVLPVIAKRLGVSVAGIDYSPNGCEQTRTMLKRERVQGEIYCVDIFNVPKELKENFDVVVSFGLIEHFTDTNEIVSALASLLKPGGVIITCIPNMRGATGWVQKILHREVFNIHIPLTPIQVNAAHKSSGLHVIESTYFLSTNFGVVNIGEPNYRSLSWLSKKVILAVMFRFSMMTWFLERILDRFPETELFSPYVKCVAMRPQESKS